MVYLDRAIGRWREGMASGVVDTKLTVRNMIEQLDSQLKQTPAEDNYLGADRASSRMRSAPRTAPA